MAKDDSSQDAATDSLQGDDEQGFDLREYWIVILEKSWLIALCTLAGLFAGLAYVKKLPTTYQAQTVVQVGNENRNFLGASTGGEAQGNSQEFYQTILESMRSRGFLKRVVEANHLDTDPAFLPPKPNGQAYLMDEVLDRLTRMIRTDLRPGTRLINVTIEHSDPQLAQKLAESVATEFIDQAADAVVNTNKILAKTLKEEAGKQLAELDLSEQKLQEYMEKNQATSLNEKLDTVVAKLRSQNTQLTEARATRVRLESDDKEVQAHAGNVQKLLSVASVANNPAVQEARQQVAAGEMQIATLDLKYTAKHPRMIEARKQMEEAKAALNKAVLDIPPWINSEFQRAVATEQKFEEEVENQKKLALELGTLAIPYRDLERKRDTNRGLYEAILKRLKELDISEGIGRNNITIFESATIPASPLNPKKSRLVAIAVGGGFMLGVMISIGLHMLDSTIKTVEQAERVTGFSVVGAIPHRSKLKESRAGAILLEEPDSNIAEAFRSLRTALYLAGRKPGRKTCLFTSALPSEGKTFSSVNHAVSLAQQGLATVLIDADLRAPKLGRLFAIDDAMPGLANRLADEASTESIVVQTGIPNLCLISAGHSISSPAELLANRGFGDLLNELGATFEHIVIDTAPVIPVSDTLLLLEHVPTVILVARANKTPRKMVLRALRLLAQSGTKPIGLILNHLNAGLSVGYPSNYGGYKKAGYTKEPAVTH